MTEDQIKHMVNRFLGWRLPKPWHPDNGISYQRPNYAHEPADHDWPIGTNLFDATQATAMVRYMLEGIPAIAPKELDAIADVVLAHKPKPKSKAAKSRKRKASKIARRPK